MAGRKRCEPLTFTLSIIGYLLFPFAILYRLQGALKFKWFQNRFVSTPREHGRKVAQVEQQVREWNEGGRKTRMCTARPMWNSFSVMAINKRELANIQVDHLNCVVEVDTVNKVLTVEPGLMMGSLTSILIPRGWTIPVVPEFETLTVGGVICGTGIESNSTKYGLSADCAIGYEMVLSSGQVVNCSKDENPDLFHSVPWSHGTLGFLTAVKFPLIPAKKYVKLEYHATQSFEEAQRLLQSQDHAFVEGIAFAKRKFVVMHGDLSDHADSRQGSLNHINRWYKPLFYKHVESFLGRPSRQKRALVEYIPLRDYYHRHTRGIFWIFPIFIPSVCNRVFLFFFGWILPMEDVKLVKRIILNLLSRRVITYLWGLGTRTNFCQDFLIPIGSLGSMLDFTHEQVQVYPLWLCPCKFFKKPGMVHSSDMGETATENELYIDVGIYGQTPKKINLLDEGTLRKFEAFVTERGGVQFLYADSHMTREEFRRMFDTSLYEKLRDDYDCLDAFPDVYDKVSYKARGIQV